MRLPTPSPRLTAAMGEKVDLSSPAVRAYVARANSDYLPWDKLRRLPPPVSLTAEGGWFAVKVSRLLQRRALRLSDPEGRSFGFWLPDAGARVLHEIDRGGGDDLALDQASDAFTAIRQEMIAATLVDEAIATSQIEGAVTTRAVAREMLRTRRAPRDRSERMIENSYETMAFLREKTSSSLTLDLLLDVQTRMTRGTLDDEKAAGRLRTEDDRVIVADVGSGEAVFTPPPAERLKERLELMLAFANDADDANGWIHPVVRATILHFWIAYEHPFVDGNGRTARAFFHWLMLKSGYRLFEFLTLSRVIKQSRTRYYRSFLDAEHDDRDVTYSVMYQLGATRTALVELRDRLEKKRTERKEATRILSRFPGLNHRQRALLEHAMHHPDAYYTYRGHKEQHAITYVTARTDLQGLVDQGLLFERDDAKQHLFFPVRELAERLGRTSVA